MVFRVEQALALQDDLIEAYSAEATQRQLQAFAAQAKRGPPALERQVLDQQETFLLKLQKSIVARHGFEASDSGVREAMLSFAADEVGRDPQVVKRNNFMETLLSAREPLDWTMGTFGLQQLRNQGVYRDLPQCHFPIVDREDWRLVDQGRVAPATRKGLLSSEDTDELAAACKRGDAAKAGLLLGARKVGASTKEVLLNIGYRGLGPSGAKALAKALSLGGLEVLELDISGNGIGVEGAQALAGSLPASLKVLKLNAANNRLTLAGVKALAAAIPREIEVLALGFSGMRMGPEGAAALAAGLPSKVRELTLDLYGNGVQDDGLVAISRALPKTLEYLNVVLLENQLGRRGLFVLDRQIGDALNEYHLPNLRAENFKKAAKLEKFEFHEAPDGSTTRQLDFREFC